MTDRAPRSWRARREAVREADVRTEQGRTLLRAALHDPHEEVRHSAITRLGLVQEVWATDLLRRLFDDVEEDVMLRREALLELAVRPAGRGVVQDALSDSSRVIRSEAQLLGRSKPQH